MTCESPEAPESTMVRRVEFTDYELALALKVGLDRHIAAMHLPNRNGCSSEWFLGLHRHQLGALGELAVAKLTNRYWGGSVGTFKSWGDVGGWEVRTRSSTDNRQLIIRPNDPDDRRFFLVRLITDDPRPVVEVVGHILACDGKTAGEFKDPGNRKAPCWLVPDEALLPIRVRNHSPFVPGQQ